jgi:hypothetical protein
MLVIAILFLRLHSSNTHATNLEDKFFTKGVLSINGEVIILDNIASRRLTDENHSFVNMTLQTAEEKDYLRFHRCFGA